MAYKFVDEPDPKKESSSFLKSAIKTPGLILSGAAAPIAGAPGDIAHLLNATIVSPITKAFTGKSLAYEETIPGKVFPSTDQALKTIQGSSEYFTPKNKYEKFVQDITKDTVSLFTPGKIFKTGKYALTPLRSLGISLGANAAKEGVVGFTGDEKKGDMVKHGLMLGFSLWNPQSAKNVVGDLYKTADQLLPATASVNANQTFNRLADIEHKVLKGRSTKNLAPSERFVIDEAEKVLDLIKNNQISIPQAVAQKTSLNENLAKHVYESSDKFAKARAKKLATSLNGVLKETFQEYGKQNPQWWKSYKEADKAASALYQSNYISRVLEKFMKGRSDTLAHVFGIGAPLGIGALSIPGSAATATAYQLVKTIHRMAKSKELSKHYTKVVSSALADNPQAINKALDGFEKEIKKEQEKSNSKYKFVD